MFGKGVPYDEIFDEQDISYESKSQDIGRRHRSLQQDAKTINWLKGPPLDITTFLSYDFNPIEKTKQKKSKCVERGLIFCSKREGEL